MLVVSSFRAEHFPLPETEVKLEEYARRYPFSYDAAEIPDIGRTVERHYPDPEHKVDAWARRFVARQRDRDTMAILLAMVQAIRAEFRYKRVTKWARRIRSSHWNPAAAPAGISLCS